MKGGRRLWSKTVCQKGIYIYKRRDKQNEMCVCVCVCARFYVCARACAIKFYIFF